MKKWYRAVLGLFGLGLVVAFFLLFFRLDPDFGWHYKYGEIVSRTGIIPREDSYSYTMPGYRLVLHEWFTEVLMYGSYERTGQMGLAVSFLMILIGGLLISYKAVKNFWLWMIPAILALSCWLPKLTTRPQIFTWFGLMILLFVLNKWDKYKIFIPFLFLLWANIHAGFGIGILVLAIYCITKRKGLVMLVISFLATLINPYGFGIWREIIATLGDNDLKNYVLEWKSSWYTFEMAGVAMFVIAIFLWRVNEKLFDVWEKVLLILLFGMGLISNRHMSLFAGYAIFFITKGLIDLRLRYIDGFMLFYKPLVLTAGAILLGTICVSMYSVYKGDLNEKVTYPYLAIDWLRQHKNKGNIFASYNWGGYLIWKLPEYKVFIDGRMPVWNKDGYKVINEYEQIVSGVSIDKLEAYKTDEVLIEAGKYNYLVSELEERGWKREYADSIAWIYTRD